MGKEPRPRSNSEPAAMLTFFSLWHLLAWTQRQLKTGTVVWGQTEGVPKKLSISGPRTRKGTHGFQGVEDIYTRRHPVPAPWQTRTSSDGGSRRGNHSSNGGRALLSLTRQPVVPEGWEKSHCFPPLSMPSLLGPRQL